MGDRHLIALVRDLSSVDTSRREAAADVVTDWLLDREMTHEDAQFLAPLHVWAMCIEPSPRVRADLLDSLDTLAEWELLETGRLAEVMIWLNQTGIARNERGYVEVFREIVERSGAVPEVPLTPERSAPLVDVLRGITSTLATERRDAAAMVPDLLPELRADEAGCFAGVLARAFVLEDDAEARNTQLATLCLAVEHGVLDPEGRRLVADALGDVTVAPDLRARWQNLTPMRA